MEDKIKKLVLSRQNELQRFTKLYMFTNNNYYNFALAVQGIVEDIAMQYMLINAPDFNNKIQIKNMLNDLTHNHVAPIVNKVLATIINNYLEQLMRPNQVSDHPGLGKLPVNLEP